ncbi:MAG: glutaredoxin family protein [Spirochaetales bacterium]|nr:glutaredoxin family protein [Spirochaetales bacterium]
MTEALQFVHEPGSRDQHSVVVYALSTCGFCRRALEFLRNNDVDFRYVYVDQLPLEAKASLKQTLHERHQIRELYPTLILNDSQALTGFDREEWQRVLGLE